MVVAVVLELLDDLGDGAPPARRTDVGRAVREESAQVLTYEEVPVGLPLGEVCPKVPSPRPVHGLCTLEVAGPVQVKGDKVFVELRGGVWDEFV